MDLAKRDGMDQSVTAKLRKTMRQLLAQKNRQWSPSALEGLARQIFSAIGGVPQQQTTVRVESTSAATPATPPPTDPEVHAAVKYLRRVGIGSLFLGVARMRSEERRVGKECRSRWSPYH